ncbi:MAG: serine acetyltransferase [Gemmatimonadota bacterium]|jgi:serine O-acetyltransferase
MTWREFFRIVRDDLRHHGADTRYRTLLALFLNPSFRLLLNYRLGYKLTEPRAGRWRLAGLLAMYLKYRQTTKYASSVSYRARIGARVRFAHPIGIVIGDHVQIGDGVTVWQHVTLGSHGRRGEDKAYPVVEEDVKIFANAVVFGGVRIERGSTVAASSVVNTDVPAGRTAVGSPARIRG